MRMALFPSVSKKRNLSEITKDQKDYEEEKEVEKQMKKRNVDDFQQDFKSRV
jgi:hypothetical protein